ncbi:MAG: hypothetical protein FJ405_02760, partial [Verrucomicrobia bacterium]|nr:hypothetical protein [Verrucomicrobiota bacterium]
MLFNFFLLLLGSLVLLSSPAAVQALDTGVEHDKTLVSVRHSNEHEIKPGSFDGDIARTTGLVLQQQHYSQKGFNTEISSRFLDRYLDLLDPMHIYFLQSDVESFDMFRNSLDKITLRRAEATPGFAIFNRFMDRLEQQYEHVMTLLKQPDWDFTGDDRYVVNRKDLPRPKDMAQAKEQWKARVRYEYLQEKLNAIEPDEISKIVREKVESGQLKELEAALKNKLGKERIDQIVKGIAGKSAEEASLFTRNHVKKSTHEDIVKTISRRYSRIVRMFREFDNDDVMGFYLTALARVYDPHSDYMDRGQLDNFSIGMNLSLFGIGAVLRSEDGYCKIAELMAAGPASKSGLLKPNDKIVAVAQAEGEWVDVVDMKLQKVVEMIRGPKGTKVRLRFNPADAADSSVRKEIELVRDEIKLEDQEAKARIIESPDAEGRIHKVGVIDLPSFYASFAVGSVNREGSDGKSTTTDVAKLLKRLVKEGVTGVVLDLRKNGGGSLEEAINLTGLFIKQGPVVQIRNSDDTVDVDEDKDPRVQYDGPLVVLTSRFSASASEILAGSLQDYG